MCVLTISQCQVIENVFGCTLKELSLNFYILAKDCLTYAHLNTAQVVPQKHLILCVVKIGKNTKNTTELTLLPRQCQSRRNGSKQRLSPVGITCIFKAVHQLDSTVLLFRSRMIQRFMSHRLCVGYLVQFLGFAVLF